jgi:hypothetical protein
VVVTGGVVVALESPGGVDDVLVDVVVGAFVVVESGVVVVEVGVVVDVAGVDGSSPPSWPWCGATMLPNVVPEPPERDSPRSHSTPVMASMPSANAATVVTTSVGHRLRLPDGGWSDLSGSASPGAASTSAPAGSSGSSSETRTVAPPYRPTTFARTVRTLSRVRWIERRYTAPPTVEITLASPAPTTVPATPMVDPMSAAVTAASAPATT